MSSHQNTLLIQAKGKTVPDDLIEKLIKENPSSLGIGTLENGVLDITVSEGATPPKNVVVELLASSKEQVIASFNNFPENAKPEDMQPFCLLFGDGDKTKPLVLGFLEGEFPDYVNPKSTRSTAWNAASEYVAVKIDDTWEIVQPDLDKLMLALDKQSVHLDIEREIGEHGTVILLGINGYMVQYGKISGKALTADWGWCSNTHGWAPKLVEPEKLVVAQQAGMKKKYIGAAPPASAPVTSVPEAPTKVIPQPVKEIAAPPDTAAAKSWPPGVWYDEKSKKVFARCPDTIMGKEKREQWYLDNAGFCPDKYKSRNPGVTVEVRGNPFKAMAPALGATAEPKKDIAAPNNAPKAVAERLPIVDATVKENYKKWLDTPQIKSIIEKKGMADPKSFQDFEDKYPSYTDLTGVPLEQTFGYAYELRYMMCKDFPEMAAILALNTTAAYARLLNHEAKQTERKEEPVQQPAPQIKQMNKKAIGA